MPPLAVACEALHREAALTHIDTSSDADRPAHRLAAASSPSPGPPRSQLVSASWASEVFSEHLLQRRCVELASWSGMRARVRLAASSCRFPASVRSPQRPDQDESGYHTGAPHAGEIDKPTTRELSSVVPLLSRFVWAQFNSTCGNWEPGLPTSSPRVRLIANAGCACESDYPSLHEMRE